MDMKLIEISKRIDASCHKKELEKSNNHLHIIRLKILFVQICFIYLISYFICRKLSDI